MKGFEADTRLLQGKLDPLAPVSTFCGPGLSLRARPRPRLAYRSATSNSALTPSFFSSLDYYRPIWSTLVSVRTVAAENTLGAARRCLQTSLPHLQSKLQRHSFQRGPVTGNAPSQPPRLRHTFDSNTSRPQYLHVAGLTVGIGGPPGGLCEWHSTSEVARRNIKRNIDWAVATRSNPHLDHEPASTVTVSLKAALRTLRGRQHAHNAIRHSSPLLSRQHGRPERPISRPARPRNDSQ